LKTTNLKDAWTPVGSLPASFAKLPAEENWKNVKAHLPGKTRGADAQGLSELSGAPRHVRRRSTAQTREVVAT
jgi:hypothetical protein